MIERDESQTAQIDDAQTMLHRNANTISKHQARIAELEQQVNNVHTFTLSD